MSLIIQASVVAIDGRALAIEGPPGSGKSTLALALIDRGAKLIGDDGATLSKGQDAVVASPPPNIAGLLEIHGVGIVELPLAPPTPLALVLSMQTDVDRLPENAPIRDMLGVDMPVLPFNPGNIAPALRAEWALRSHGLASA